MRLTLDLISFDFDDAAFASLWLDTEMHRWSRESHELLNLPGWGVLVSVKGETRLCGQSETEPATIVRLEMLDLDQLSESTRTHERSEPPGTHDRSTGRALLYGADAGGKPSVGKWKILYIDHETTRAEHSYFADDKDDQ